MDAAKRAPSNGHTEADAGGTAESFPVSNGEAATVNTEKQVAKQPTAADSAGNANAAETADKEAVANTASVPSKAEPMAVGAPPRTSTSEAAVAAPPPPIAASKKKSSARVMASDERDPQSARIVERGGNEGGTAEALPGSAAGGDASDDRTMRRKRAATAAGAAGGASATTASSAAPPTTQKRQRTDSVSAEKDDDGAAKANSRRSSRQTQQDSKGERTGVSRGAKARMVNPASRSPPRPEVPKRELGTLEEYRELRLRLEKLRHSRVYEAEKRRLYAQLLVKWNYNHEVRLANAEFDGARRLLMQRLLQENIEQQRRVEELRYKIIRDDVPGAWQRRHEMSLRGRHVANGNGAGEHGGAAAVVVTSEADTICDTSLGGDRGLTNAARNRRRVSVDRARVRVELEAGEVMEDLAEITGEKTRAHDQVDSTNASVAKENSARRDKSRSLTRSRRGVAGGNSGAAAVVDSKGEANSTGASAVAAAAGEPKQSTRTADSK